MLAKPADLFPPLQEEGQGGDGVLCDPLLHRLGRATRLGAFEVSMFEPVAA